MNLVKRIFSSEEILNDIKYLDTNYLDKLLNYLINDESIKVPINDYIKCESIFKKYFNELYDSKSTVITNDSDPFKELNKKKLSIDNYIFDIVNIFIIDSSKKIIESLDNDKYIEFFSKFIEKFKQIMRSLHRFRKPKTETSIGLNLHYSNLKESLDLFKSKVFNDKKSENRCFEIINSEIEKDRLGVIINREQINSIIDFLECLGYYDPIIDVDPKTKEIFIVPMIEGKRCDIKNDKANIGKIGIRELRLRWYSSQEKKLKVFLKNFVNEKIENLNAPEYIFFFNKYIEREKMLIKCYFPLDAHKLVESIVFEKIIGEQAEILKNKPSGFENMFLNLKLDELSETYKFFLNYEPSLDIFLKEMNKYIKGKGKEIYADEILKKEPIKIIVKTIELQKNIYLIIQDCFNNHMKYIDSSNKAFNAFMKEGQIYPKFLAIYCDSYMKINVQSKNATQLEEDFNNIISLLRCLNDKHVFKMEFSKLLSERILNNKTRSLEAEKSLISKISNELGQNFVYEFKIIIQDIDNSSQFNDSFRLENHKGIISGVNLNCKFLQYSAWKIDKSKDFRFEISEYSPKLKKCMDVFRDFYTKSNKSKKLQYIFGSVSNKIINRDQLKLKLLTCRKNTQLQ